KEDIEKAMRRMSRKDSKQQKETSVCAKRFNEYIVLITSLPDEIGADQVLSAYRYRWQVELYFKRLKSLLGMGEVPKKRAECMEAWLNGKMLLAVLFEVLLSKLDFSPLTSEEMGKA
ncbi:MAG: transposase, partial [Candidatus Accumulibacter sp.]|nr:transposase [Accumulibacter sp.]